MKERIDHQSSEQNTILLNVERVGAGIVNLVGSGISLGSIIYFIENLGDKPVESSLMVTGGILAGGVITSIADSVKRHVWEEDSKNSNPTA